MILSDEVSDDYNLDNGTESDGNYVEPIEGDSKCAEDAMLDNYCCTEVELLTTVSSERIRRCVVR
jgi:hypothetical protein